MPSWKDAFRMALPPAIVALAVTLLRLAGELQGWSEAWFSRATSGLVPTGAVSWLVGITWLALPFGAWFAWRLVHSGTARPTAPHGLFFAAVALVACAFAPLARGEEDLAAKVRAREAAFAKTMADRDLAAFATFVSEEALFAGRTVRRGRAAVVEGWKPYFEGPKAPFSWQPERVEVVDSGTLALSTGPVFDPEGKRSGTFTSTWRLEKDGEWRVVLDSGCPPCSCP